LAGEEWYWVARALGPYAAPLAADIAALGLFADQVNALGAEIFAQQDANLNAIARAAARDNEGKANPGEQCKTENSGGGAKRPPAAKGDVAADDDGPDDPFNWGRPETLQDHFDRHGADVGARTSQEYARMAEKFRAEAERAGYHSFRDSQGTQRIYDQATNRFGSYNADGSTRTFFSPSRGPDYWVGQLLRFK
jgi:hypothetical protein